MIYIDLLFILILLASQILENNLGYFHGFYKDFKAICSSPFRWKIKDWIYVGIVISLTIILYIIDPLIKTLALQNTNLFIDIISKTAKLFGDGNVILFSIIGFYICGVICKNKRARKTALLCLESLLITALFIQALKFSFHRHRPSSGDLFNSFNGPGLSGDNLSFPSGHASAAFSVLTVIAKEYHDIPIIPPLAYGMALLTAFSRVHDNAHWGSDVFFASCLAYFIAGYITGSHKSFC